MSTTPTAAPLPPPLVPLAFLLGRWGGEGIGGYPTIEGFRYRQEVEFSHAGMPVLAYRSTAWLLDDAGAVVRLSAREVGWWRPQPDGGVEAVLAHPSGIVEVYVGTVTGQQVELSTDVVARTATAKEVSANHRLYGLVEGALLYAVDMAAVGQPLQPHLSARLDRLADSS